MTDRIVLGINDGHPSTVCLIKNGEIVSCISEERLNRIKNSVVFPVMAIKKALEQSNIQPEEIDLICISSKDIRSTDLNSLGSRKKESRLGVLSFSYATQLLPTPLVERLCPYASKARARFKQMDYKQRYNKDLKSLNLDGKEVVFYDHHTVHAHTAYYLNPDRRSPSLIFTCDGEGDGLCATVSIAEKGEIIREVSIPFIHSIGKMYNEVTWYLGLKPWEHEYKVMGMAPYANQKYVGETWNIFKKMVVTDPRDKRRFYNETGRWAHTYGNYLKKKLHKHRFDNISYSIQKLLEDTLQAWIKNNIEYYGVSDILVSGGVFMNVKANQKIFELECVDSLFITPSAADESTAIGCAITGYIDLCKRDGVAPSLAKINNLYLGPEYSDDDIAACLTDIDKNYNIERFDEVEAEVSRILSDGDIVARFSGRMEFGARALGNRSILANPSSLNNVTRINDQIKKRDFWMPFAPTILRYRSEDYLKRPQKPVDDQYMVISFNTTQNGKTNLRSALHSSDLTARPQVLDRKQNPEYFNLIQSFEDRTGIGAVLNTSFNIHGEPIVCSPEDAISTFRRSGLRHLAIGDYIVSKD